jgi:hypothetical protein
MNPTKISVWTLGLGVILASAVACAPPPKVMTSHQYLGEARSAKTLIQQSGKGTDDGQLYNYFLRVCDLNTSTEKQCKDSLILENVTPRSVY